MLFDASDQLIESSGKCFPRITWNVFPDSLSLACALATKVRQVAERRARRFKIVFSGGNSLLPLFDRLASEAGIDWGAWEIYLSDERCLPSGHMQRNSRTLEDHLLKFAAIPSSQTHMIPSELGPAEAASRYELIISEAGRFDVVVLSVGEDGHVASLFGNALTVSHGTRLVVPVTDAPKWPSERVSLSFLGLNNTSLLFVVATGSAKRPAVEEWRKGSHLPVSMLEPILGVEAYVDATAYF